MIANHVALLAVFLLNFCQEVLQKVSNLQKIMPYFLIYGNLLVSELIIKGWEGLIIDTVEMAY